MILQRFGASVLVCVLSAGLAMAQDTRIAVVGEGRVVVVPDMATLSLGVEARAETAGAAMAQVAEAMTGVMAVLEAAGIAARDVQSSGVYLQPLYEEGPRDGTPPRQTGLVANSELSVRVRDVARLGTLLDDVTQAGGNRFSGLSWDVQDRAPLMEQARRAAVADGIAKATLYAGAAQVTLGPIVDIAEVGSDPQPGFMAAEAMRAMPIAAGEIEVTAQLRMVFDTDD